jgi:hypothetical protein
MKPKKNQHTERGLEETEQYLVELIKSAQVFFGTDATELRTCEAALEGIRESQMDSKERRKRRNH